MRPEDAKKELAAAVAGLKWTIAGLRMAGISHWPPAHESLEFKSVAPGLEPFKAVGSATAQPSAPTLGAVSDLAAAQGLKTAVAEVAQPSIPGLAPEVALAAAQGLEKIGAELEGCSRCRLHTGRRTIVFGEGSGRSGLVFVGEGPGFDEDQQGRPFVGRAGKLLDKMIRAIGLARDDVYICNVVKCRPPENRTPLADEMEACLPFLFRQIETLKPRLICALGASAAQALLGRSAPISKIRGKVLSWRGFPLICTFHPAYLLRSSAQKGAAWQDLREAHRVLTQNMG